MKETNMEVSQLTMKEYSAARGFVSVPNLPKNMSNLFHGSTNFIFVHIVKYLKIKFPCPSCCQTKSGSIQIYYLVRKKLVKYLPSKIFDLFTSRKIFHFHN